MCSSPLSGGRGLLSPPEGLEGSWGTMLNPNPRLQALLPCEVLGVCLHPARQSQEGTVAECVLGLALY